MEKTLLFFFALLSINCFSQFSKTHYIPPLTCANNLAGDQYLYISTPSTANVKFKIIANGVTIYDGIVSNNSPNVYPIGQGANTQLLTPKNVTGILTNKGYIIEAEDLVYVSVRLNSSQNGNGTYNHAGGLVSKGNSALGREFRLGAMLNPKFDNTVLNFASILSTENNTKITISNIPTGTILSDGTIITAPIEITLNKNESYVLAMDNSTNMTPSNSSKIIGVLIKSTELIVVNSGSFGGSNSTEVNSAGAVTGRDVGFDQIVPFEKTGKEYIFIKGKGTIELEQVLLVAHKDNTSIYVNGNTMPSAILNAGEHINLDGSYFSNGYLYITSSENVFAYQSIGGGTAAANQNLFFVPPINCATPKTVNNIPFIESIGNITFNGGLNIVTETGATVLINNQPLTVAPITIIPNPGYIYYTIAGLSGNISVKSTKQVYVSYFGSNGAATYGGYYSGFDTKPEIVSDKISVTNSACIPNVVLQINTLSSYDSFQWYKNDVAIIGETSNSYRPTTPGYYQVKGAISGCPSSVPIFSDKIPVSNCPTDLDNDTTNDNIDIDNDNDGITNCAESYGDQNLDISAIGIINSSGPNPSVAVPFQAKTDGTFVSEVPAGKENSVSYDIVFPNPTSVAFEYITTANASDLINSDSEFILKSPIDKTITVLNPDNQLLIDTNYDGVFESGITTFSSFEIRFRLNSTIPLAAGTGTFSFRTYLTDSLTFIQKNLSQTSNAKATFLMKATCVPKDSDGDGVSDQLDLDSDNDNIPDTIEAQGTVSSAFSNNDTNKNGLDSAFEPGFIPVDTDGDGVADYIDLDSDNDGILDSVETATDFDGDGIKNYRDLDTDGDLCLDVIEAGFLDPDGDGKFGNSTVSVDANGLVISAPYTTPNANYLIAAPILITVQPQTTPTCHLQNTLITLTDNADSYQWQISTDGVIWNDILNDLTYSDVTTNTLGITSVKNSMNGYKYRVQLNKTGNSCGLISTETALTVYPLPVINSPIVLKQCDDDINGRTIFNLTQKNSFISPDATHTFSYFENNSDALVGAGLSKIANPTAYANTTPFNQTIYVRVENSNGCATTGNLELKISTTTIPSGFNRPFSICDDLTAAANSDYDGISVFDFHSVTNDIKTTFLTGTIPYSISYYRNENDALSEINPLNQSFPSDPTDPTSIYNYRNIGYPNTQQIWVRVDSTIDNACFGLGPYINLTVEKLPIANPVSIPRQCDDNQDGIYIFDTSKLETTLLGTNQSFPVTVQYFDSSNNALKDFNGLSISSPFPSTFSTTSQIIKAVVTNATTLQCYDETTIEFTVDDLPQAFAVAQSLMTACDNEADPLLQDGKYAFDTSTFQNTILGGQTAMIVTYFDENGDPLQSPLPNPFITGTQNVTAIVVNPLNPSCTVSVILPFIVNPLPRINLNLDSTENELVCSNIPTFVVSLTAGIQDGSPTSDYAYVWTKDGLPLPDTSPTINVNAEGNYTVAVSTIVGCSRTRTIKVTASDIATITKIDIVDFTDINSVTVNVSGTGKYEFSLDDPSGPYQTSNVFNNVPSGIHDVYVKDINGCGTASKTISVIGVPKFFTPNNDGFNDFWNVRGINSDFNPNSIIYIFDRYGKLLKQLNPLGQGWDGTFNGVPLPSDDYWYTIKLEDGREAKGHFSLKR